MSLLQLFLLSSTQQLLSLLILRPAKLTLTRLQLRLVPSSSSSRTRSTTNTSPRSILQSIRILFPQILTLARLLIIISQRERIIVFFRVWGDGSQGLPFLGCVGVGVVGAVVGGGGVAVEGVDFVYGAGLGGFGLGFEEVGVRWEAG